jgi:glutathione S-transferase
LDHPDDVPEQAMTTPVLYAHPFSSYSQKVLMALYEKAAPFELRLLSAENPSASAELRALWPLERFPVLHAEGRTLIESSVIIEWLDMRHSTGARLIPTDPDLALEIRMLDRIFDNYVMTPMMTVVFDRLRPVASRDPHGVGLAHALLDRSYRWLDDRMASRAWAAGEAFSLADCAAAPALFYADWVRPVAAHPSLASYLRRLRARPSFARCVEDARTARHLFPGGAPTDRD